MSNAIKAGDLVMVVSTPHPCAVEYLHTVHTVLSVGAVLWYCEDCHVEMVDEFAVTDSKDASGFPVAWLRRIPPPALPESIEHHEEITA